MTAKLYKIQIHDYGNDEVNWMAIAYEALGNLPFDAQPRCLDWLTARIKADRLAVLDAPAPGEAGQLQK